MQSEGAPTQQTAWTWWTLRIQHIPKETSREEVRALFIEKDRPRIRIESLAPEIYYNGTGDYELTATISYRALNGGDRKPQVIDEVEGLINVDDNFYGFTPLNCPERPIAADVVAVAGLAGHAFASWKHDSTRMWLRDYLPLYIKNTRILTYGYPSQLQRSESMSSLWDHSNNLRKNLLAMQDEAQCRERPVIFIGHGLGCLIIKKVMVDAPLPVPSIIFLGAPHRGLENTALKTLVKGTMSENMINDLSENSTLLKTLDIDFGKLFSQLHFQILTCYEQYTTPTINLSSDGSWKRDGPRKMMVTPENARLGYEQEQIAVYSNHSGIAKIDRAPESPFLHIRRAIATVLPKEDRQTSSLGLSHPHTLDDASSSAKKTETLLEQHHYKRFQILLL